jgi:poly(3-hydroxybutyrate) depolymerase
MALILNAIDQVCLLHPVDSQRVAMAGLSAGASMAALLATRHPGRFKALVMHSGIPPGTARSTLTALGAMRGRRAAATLAAGPGPSSTDHGRRCWSIHGHALTPWFRRAT